MNKKVNKNKNKMSIYSGGGRNTSTWTTTNSFYFTYKIERCAKTGEGGPGETMYLFLVDMMMAMTMMVVHRPSAEVKDSANPAGRAGMLPLLSSRLRLMMLPSVMLASDSCHPFTIWSSGRCRSMPM